MKNLLTLFIVTVMGIAVCTSAQGQTQAKKKGSWVGSVTHFVGHSISSIFSKNEEPAAESLKVDLPPLQAQNSEQSGVNFRKENENRMVLPFNFLDRMLQENGQRNLSAFTVVYYGFGFPVGGSGALVLNKMSWDTDFDYGH